jgi:hypothetical protein
LEKIDAPLIFFSYSFILVFRISEENSSAGIVVRKAACGIVMAMETATAAILSESVTEETETEETETEETVTVT